MLTPNTIEALPDLPAPLLTAYLDTNRAKVMNRAVEPGYLIHLDSGAKRIEEQLDPEDREHFREQVGRARTYLRTHPPRSKGVLIFAGPQSWEIVPLDAEVEEEIHWGAPELGQLVWLANEHKPYGIVVVDSKHAEFFLYWLGEMLELEERKFTLQPSKEKEMGPVSRAGGVLMSRGTNRDVFEHHREAQYARYYRKIAEDLGRWADAEHLQRVLLVGRDEVVKAIQKRLSQAQREKVVLVEEDCGWMPREELRRRVEPIVAREERDREVAAVEELLGDHPGCVVGLDETLARLQQGKVRNLLVAKGLDANLKRCGECLWVDRTNDPVCPACGRERHAVRLREVLPELARRYKIAVEVISGEAGRKLQEAGGMGAWLHEFERKDYGEHLIFR